MREREKEKYEREEKRDEEARKGTEGRRKREEAHIPPTRGGSQRGGPGPTSSSAQGKKDVSFQSSDPTFDKHRSTTVFHLPLSLSLSLLPFPPPPSTVIPRSFTASNQFSPKRLGSPRSRLNPLAQKSPLSFSLSFSPPSIERRFGGRDGRKTDGRVPCTRHR